MNLNDKSGLTLLELIIAMTLSIIILITLFAGMRVSYKSQESGYKKTKR